VRALVTGSNGFIGQNLKSYLEGRGHTVIGVDLRSAAIVGDVTDSEFVVDLAKQDFDSIIHLAAIADVRTCIREPYSCYRTNSFGTLNMLELAIKKRVRRFIYSSSANVYGVPDILPVKENAPLNPRTPYDHSKVLSEEIIRSFGTLKSLPFVILRSWKLFGEHDVPTTAVSRFIYSCLRGEPLQLYNAGRDTTDPYHIDNYCRAVELCLEREGAIGEAFNIGTGNEVSIRRLAELIRKLTNSSSSLMDLPPRTPEEAKPMRSYPSIAKIKDILGYEPIVSLEEGLERTIKYQRGLHED
jgi:nucleoside-diphosphate-sugar epimerase